MKYLKHIIIDLWVKCDIFNWKTCFSRVTISLKQSNLKEFWNVFLRQFDCLIIIVSSGISKLLNGMKVKKVNQIKNKLLIVICIHYIRNHVDTTIDMYFYSNVSDNSYKVISHWIQNNLKINSNKSLSINYENKTTE